MLFFQAYVHAQSKRAAESRWNRIAGEICILTYFDNHIAGPRRKPERLTNAVAAGDGRSESELKLGTESA